jgi:predicted DNA-binding transcriptional regulator YafY
VGGARTDLSGLTADEARALFLIAGPSGATPEVRAALRKLMQALPATFRQQAQAAASAVVLDPSGWDHGVPAAPDHLDALQQAVIEGVQVELDYRGRDGKASSRTVHPLGLVVKHNVWYLVAETDAGQRTFRVSRVRSLRLTTEPVVRPDDFDLAGAWRSIVTAVEAERAPARVRVRADATVVDVLRYVFGNRVDAGVPGPDGRIEVELRGQSEDMVARQLAGFGDRLEIVEPESVRRQLADIGHGLLRAHAREGRAVSA